MTTAIVHSYQPVGSALELFKCQDPEVLLSGSAGTGKSRACLEKLHALCLKFPGMRGLIVRKTAVSLTSTALVTFREHVADKALESGELKFYGGSSGRAAAFVYANGSEVTVTGLDKATKVMSSEYDHCYVQEATELTQDDWEMVSTRLRNGKTPFHQLMADCNPGPPQHWLNQRCIAGQARMILCRHEDNPRFYRHGAWTPEGQTYIARLDALTGVRKLRLRDGIWAAAEGLVYDGFDPATHCYRLNAWSHPPDSWPRFMSVDFGYTNPFVAQWWAQDPDGRLYLYREIYKTRTLVEDHAKHIAKLFKTRWQERTEPEPQWIACDHDAEDRATLERHLGRSTIAAKKDVSPGIEAVQARLKLAGDGKPRLYICRDAVVERDPALVEARKPIGALEEIAEYVWDARPQPGAAGTVREAPVKSNDHSMDAMRYLVAQLDLVGKPRMRSFTY